MAQYSPILRFALDVFQHALECYCSKNDRDKKISVLNFAQSIELAMKASLVERNITIYEKNGRTINAHEALAMLAKARSIDRVEGQARLEVLIDERNAIQHRYGSVDDITLDYHVETAFTILGDILRIEFDTDLSGWVKDNVDKVVWEKIRFVSSDEEESQRPSDAIVEDRSPTIDFLDGFSRFEKNLRSRINETETKKPFSTLDILIKALSNIEHTPDKLIKEIPKVYKIRNKIVHGDPDLNISSVQDALRTLDDILSYSTNIPDDIWRASIEASSKGVRGARINIKVPKTIQNEISRSDLEADANGKLVPE